MHTPALSPVTDSLLQLTNVRDAVLAESTVTVRQNIQDLLRRIIARPRSTQRPKLTGLEPPRRW